MLSNPRRLSFPSDSGSVTLSLVWCTEDDASSFSLPLPLSVSGSLFPVPLPTSPARPAGGADPDTAGACAHWGAGAEPATGEGAGGAAAPRIGGQQGNAPAAARAALPPLGLCVMSDSSLAAVIVAFFFCAPSRREVEVWKHAPSRRDAYMGLPLWDLVPHCCGGPGDPSLSPCHALVYLKGMSPGTRPSVPAS